MSTPQQKRHKREARANRDPKARAEAVYFFKRFAFWTVAAYIGFAGTFTAPGLYPFVFFAVLGIAALAEERADRKQMDRELAEMLK